MGVCGRRDLRIEGKAFFVIERKEGSWEDRDVADHDESGTACRDPRDMRKELRRLEPHRGRGKDNAVGKR